METRSTKPYIIVVCLMLLTSLALAFSVDVHVTDQAGISVALPDRVGSWTGVEMRFCVSRTCQSGFAMSELADAGSCPKCSEPLDTMAYIEKVQLPADTVILKKRYTRSTGEKLFASIVLSGKERASIHRPQVCLTGQGREITRSEVLPVPLADREKPLKVMLLDLYQKWERQGRVQEHSNYYAYWFVGKERETPHHMVRMYWMASDRVLKNVAHRWAYIAVTGPREPDNRDHEELVKEFLSLLYPEIQAGPAT